MTYSDQLKAFQRRRQTIVRLFQQKNPRLSLKAIGQKLDPPITPQRVGDIVRKEGVTR
ncbi:MAG: hypothetical protein ACTS6J_24725 [Burkholderiales bacterium]